MHTFIIFADPAHAWCCVPRSLIRDLGIGPQISRCSYQKLEEVYLEEDCDLGIFVKAYEAKYGARPKFRDRHTNGDSPIRGYPRFEWSE